MERMKTAGGAVVLTIAIWLAAGSAAADAAVARTSPHVAVSASVSITSSAPAAVVGGPAYTLTASTTSDKQVSFGADQATTNAACAVTGDVVSFQHAGACVVDAQVAADSSYAAALAQQTITVAPAATTTALVIGPSATTATVAATEPGGGTPAGTVVFSVGGRLLGSAAVSGGVATLAYTVPPNVTEAILASYQGEADHTSSSATVVANGLDIEPTFVAEPTIAARVTSSAPRNDHGWWHTALTVHFICDAAGSEIVGGCPGTEMLSRSGTDLTLTRTIRTVAGGQATVTLRGIKLDTTRPRVELVGIRSRAAYHGSRPPVSCAATDAVSGIRSCEVVTTVKRGAKLETITYTATATSWAGVTQRTVETIHATS
jgi:hypothetical protein